MLIIDGKQNEINTEKEEREQRDVCTFQINDEAIQEYRKIYRDAFGIELTEEEAKTSGLTLISLFKTILVDSFLPDNNLENQTLSKEIHENRFLKKPLTEEKITEDKTTEDKKEIQRITEDKQRFVNNFALSPSVSNKKFITRSKRRCYGKKRSI